MDWTEILGIVAEHGLTGRVDGDALEILAPSGETVARLASAWGLLSIAAPPGTRARVVLGINGLSAELRRLSPQLDIEILVEETP